MMATATQVDGKNLNEHPICRGYNLGNTTDQATCESYCKGIEDPGNLTIQCCADKLCTCSFCDGPPN